MLFILTAIFLSFYFNSTSPSDIPELLFDSHFIIFLTILTIKFGQTSIAVTKSQQVEYQ